jgi:hypothetical protein
VSGPAGPFNGTAVDDANRILKILAQAPIVVDSGFVRAYQIKEPPDFRGPMVLLDNSLGQLITDGRSATAIFHAATSFGGADDNPRAIDVALTQPPSLNRNPQSPFVLKIFSDDSICSSGLLQCAFVVKQSP